MLRCRKIQTQIYFVCETKVVVIETCLALGFESRFYSFKITTFVGRSRVSLRLTQDDGAI